MEPLKVTRASYLYILFLDKETIICEDLRKTVVLEKTLESPLNCKEIQPVHPKENQRSNQRSHQSIVKEISHEYSLKGLMLKLKLQLFGYLM